MLNTEKSDLPMYKVSKVLRFEDIEPPTYDVRMKSARQTNTENYGNLMSKAF